MSAMKFLILSACAQLATARMTPVQQVLAMLSDMKAKGEKSVSVEQMVFADYKEWVSDQTTKLGFDIKTAETSIERLEAFIDETDNKAARLASGIAELDAEIGKLEGEKKDATEIRDSEKADFEKASQDLSESVDALERAIQVTSSESYDRPQAAAMLQRMAKNKPAMRRVLAAFLQEEGQSKDDGAPAVAAYTFQSGEIVALLEGLLKKFKGELSDAMSEESNKQHYYDLDMIQLTDTIGKAKASREGKAANKAAAEGESAKAKGELAATKKQLASDKKFLSDMTAEFKTKEATFSENQKVRATEIEALSKAIEIISTPDVSGSYAEHVKLVQVASKPVAANFLQMRSTKRRVSAKAHASEVAAKYLRKRAADLSSKVLLAAAESAAGNPFEKVVTMIKGLLETLKAEAAAEAEHKAWCDEQLKENKLKREAKTTEVNRLIAEIDVLSGDIETMGRDIATLAQEQADLAAAMTSATSQRSKEKSTNTDTISDAQAGSEAVKQAMVVLNEFYSSQASLLQQKQKGKETRQVPAMEAYGGMQDSKGGVIGMLEVIETDFMRLETETKAAEAQAQHLYDDFMYEAKASKEMKHREEVKLRLDKDQAEFEKSQKKKDLSATETELARANDYFSDLKPVCVEIHVDYETRVARRKEELAALNEAYKILEAKTAA